MYMFSQLTKQNFAFINAGAGKFRSEKFLKDQMSNQLIVEVIDFKSKVLAPVLDRLSTLCSESATSYVNLLLSDVIIAFSVFFVLLVTAMALFSGIIVQRIKIGMLNTNLILQIMPFEQMTKATCEQVKKFVSLS